MKVIKKASSLIFFGMIIILFFGYTFSWLDEKKEDVLSCASNINFNLSDNTSSGPIINGILNIHLSNNGYGFLEVSGIIKWQGDTYPVSKRLNIKHDLKDATDKTQLLTIHAINSLSLEHDQSPPGIVEKYLVGDHSQPVRILNFKKLLANGYLIGNLNSPIMICIDR
ncbi:hypothetical protein [Serratia sp. D1N4]